MANLVNLRGFSAGDDYFMDGLRDTGLYDRDVFDYEAIEVYKGPASTLFGRGSTGGVINQVLKTPQLFPIYDFAVTGGTNAEIRATADVNYVLGDTSALRVNVMGQRNNQKAARSRACSAGASRRRSPMASTRYVFTLKIPAPAGRQHPRLRRAVPVGKPAPVPQDTFLRPAVRRPLQD